MPSNLGTTHRVLSCEIYNLLPRSEIKGLQLEVVRKGEFNIE